MGTLGAHVMALWGAGIREVQGWAKVARVRD